MRVLLIGAGGVGSAFARIAARRGSFEEVTVADHDLARAERVAQSAGAGFRGVSVDARNEEALLELIRHTKCDAVLNAVDPRFVMPIFRAALAGGVTYLDMAMSLSRPDPDAPFEKTGVMLGDEQFELGATFEERGLLALVGIGVEPGLSDVFARHAADAGDTDFLRPEMGVDGFGRDAVEHHVQDVRLVTALPDRAIEPGRRTILQEYPKKLQCIRRSFIG